ncbi:MAG: dienelactone hydrolase family protein [Alphaproteobacteria bacterium]|nr:dienelactone hydrolase family protein [Alphaproteobacteria bacterium]
MSDLPELSGPEAAPASGGPAKQLIIFVHGYGANGEDLISLSRYYAQVAPDAAFISPDAPYRCDGAPMGFQWYDVWMKDPAERLAAIRSSGEIFDNFVTGQLARHGLSEDKLVLIGFSQGTMMSLFTAPRRENAIAGIVGYSGRMESADTLKAEIRSKPPVVMVHGDSDELLAVSEMETAAATLRDCGVEIDTHIRPGLGHGIDEEGIRVGLAFVQKVLG